MKLPRSRRNGLGQHWLGRRIKRRQVEPLERRCLLSASHLNDLNWISDTPGTNSFTGGAYYLTVDAEGEHAYVASTEGDQVNVYQIDQETGELLLDSGQPHDREVWDENASTVLKHMVRPHSIAISPDGAHVYVAAQGPDGNGNDAAILTFDRGSDGRLTAKPESWTISDDTVSTSGVTDIDGIRGAAEVRISADGKFVYVTGRNDNALTVLARETDDQDADYGRLSEVTGGSISSTGKSTAEGGSMLLSGEAVICSPCVIC